MTVLFLLERAESWVNVHRLWRVMRDDARFSATVWVVPNCTIDLKERERQVSRCLAVCSERGVPATVWKEGLLGDDVEFDVAVYLAPYDRNRPPELYFDLVAEKVRFTVYIPYGLVTGDGEKNRWLQYAQPTQCRADLVVARSQHEKRAYRRFCPTGDHHVAVLGHPRFDELFDLDRFAIDPTLEARVAGRLAVLWNSHYSFLPRFAAAENYSTFDRLGGALVAHAVRHPDLALIWRPHPHLFAEMVGAGILAGGELCAFKREVEDIGVILDERPDHRHAFAASDALLSDAGSFLFEYLATGKPILYLRNPNGEPLNDEATALVAYYDVAESEEDVMAFLERLRNGDDLQRDRRLAARSLFIPRFDGRASERTADRIAAMCEYGTPSGPPAVDGCRFPLVTRLLRALDAIRTEKEQATPAATTLLRGKSATKRWVMRHVNEHPTLLRTISGVLDKVGVRKASGG